MTIVLMILAMIASAMTVTCAAASAINNLTA